MQAERLTSCRRLLLTGVVSVSVFLVTSVSAASQESDVVAVYCSARPAEAEAKNDDSEPREELAEELAKELKDKKRIDVVDSATDADLIVEVTIRRRATRTFENIKLTLTHKQGPSTGAQSGTLTYQGDGRRAVDSLADAVDNYVLKHYFDTP